MDFSVELNSLKDIVNSELESIFKDKDFYQKKIFDSIDYSLFAGGKRLRPIMVLKSCEMFNNSYSPAMPYALAIEMIHTYSLVHDDLPAMDNDDFRRGNPTNHKVYGEAIAILAGDGLLNYAFEIILNNIVSNAKTIRDYEIYTKASQEISFYSGVHGMIGGQVVDLLSNHESMSADKLLFMYKTKTAALIQASLVSGAIIGGATDFEIEAIREYGLNLGLAYQIKDDILDIEEDNDINKLTYLSFHDIEKAKLDLIKYSENAMDILKSIKGRDISFFLWLTEELVYRNK